MTTYKFNIFTKIQKWFDTSSPVYTTRLSMLVCILMASGGIIIGITEESLAVQINGLISAIDILNSIIFITAVNHSMKSPDHVFNYGYGKYESLSLLAAAGLLLIVLGYALYEAALTFGNQASEGGNYYVLLSYSIVTLGVMLTMYKMQRKAAKRFKMPILDYDAQIWKIDSMLEIGVLSNLILGAILQYFHQIKVLFIIDSITAVGLLIFALKVPLKGSKDALNQLLDRTLPDEIQFNILGVVAENLTKMCEFRNVHTRQSGKDIFIEIDVIMPNDYTIDEKWALEVEIKNKILKLYPTAVPRLYTTPCKGDCIQNGVSYCPVKKMKISKNVDVKF